MNCVAIKNNREFFMSGFAARFFARGTLAVAFSFIFLAPDIASAASAATKSPAAAAPTKAEIASWQAQSQRVTILRDKWGVPHIYAKTDADVVFGMLYAQAEDDFNRIEVNYLNALGRLAEAEGEKALYSDLRMKLFIDPADLKAKYRASPPWLKKLMDSFAAGLNYYLYMHAEVKPKVLMRFEPWMALSFTEGSIGGDIESVNLRQLEAFYGGAKTGSTTGAAAAMDDDDSFNIVTAQTKREAEPELEPRGSNGFAIAPANTASGHSLLLINPHTSFYFRSEMQVVSDEGLNAYGAVTWGQFFIYQGFNNRLGWMHTSGGGDAIDEFAETIVIEGDKRSYKYGETLRPLKTSILSVPYKTADGVAEKKLTVYHSHHGPIIREDGDKWVAVKLMQEPIKALTQSYMRTKAKNYADFNKVMDLRTNSSNNTVYADGDGNIAYYHGDFIPIRDTRFDFTKPVDGSNPATDWKGLHEVKDIIQLFNPATGWIQNTNNWPFSSAGSSSPKRENYPVYMWNVGENARGVHAVRMLEGKNGFTLDSLIAAAYDTQLTAFEPLLPRLLQTYGSSKDAAQKAALREPIEVLRAWDKRYDLKSEATSLAIYWYQEVRNRVGEEARTAGISLPDFIANQTPGKVLLDSLAAAVAKLEKDFGGWKTPWGEINRLQRLTGDILQPFDDSKPSIAIPYASGNYGSLASFGMGAARGTQRIYGEVGNSFVAAVEFGPRIKAKSILVGGQSGNPASPHFNDQSEMYSRGEFKDVLFYREDVEKNLERKYHPGE